MLLRGSEISQQTLESGTVALFVFPGADVSQGTEVPQEGSLVSYSVVKLNSAEVAVLPKASVDLMTKE